MTVSASTGTSATPRNRKSRILEHIEVSERVRELILDAPDLASVAVPGQFVHVLCKPSGWEGYDPLLRRPFSIHDADPEAGTVSVLYEIRGRGTADLARKLVGDDLDLLAPLGNGFPLPTSGDRPIVLIAGGIAVAPLYFLARRISETIGMERTTVIIGARSECLLVCVEKYARLGGQLRLATDDGSTGYHGFVTGPLNEYIEQIDKTTPPVIYSCGPMAMLHSISKITNAHGLDCYVSTEEKMACGVGACMSCAVPIRDGDSWKYVRSCKEGPVFRADEVIWE